MSPASGRPRAQGRKDRFPAHFRSSQVIQVGLPRADGFGWGLYGGVLRALWVAFAGR